VSPLFKEIATEGGFYNEELMHKIAERGTLQGLEEIPPQAQSLFITAHDITPEWHIRLQAAFQRHTDNAVSKTINFPHEATVEEVKRAYLMAYELGCKGLTIYRDRSRERQVLEAGIRPEGTDQSEVLAKAGKKPRPQALGGVTYRMNTPLGTAYITVNDNEAGEPFEVFVNIGKAGSDISALAETFGRLSALILRLPSPLSPTERAKEIIDELHEIGGSRPIGFGPNRIRSLPDAIARVLAQHLGLRVRNPKGPTQLELPLDSISLGDLCPECGHATYVIASGCGECYNCGYTEC